MVGRRQVQSELHPFLATRIQRFLAYFIDIMIIGLPLMYLHLQRPELMQVLNAYSQDPSDPQKLAAYSQAMQPVSWRIFLSYLVYCFFLEGSEMQATLGKRWLGIKVVKADGTGLSVWESLFRSSSKIASYVVFSLGFIWILFDPYRQGWHDKLADTLVVTKDCDIQIEKREE